MNHLLLTKKNILFTGIAGTILFLLSVFSQEMGFCTPTHRSCIQIFDSMAEILQIFLPFFLLYLITYKLREEIYIAWFRFASWWIPLSMLLTLIAPSQSHDWMFPIDKGRVSFFMSLFFALISLILIVYKFFILKKTRLGN